MAESNSRKETTQLNLIKRFAALTQKLISGEDELSTDGMEQLSNLSKQLADYVAKNATKFDSILHSTLSKSNEAAELAEKLLLCINKTLK